MLPVGGISLAGIGGTRGFDITPGAISKACKMGERLILTGGRGEGLWPATSGAETSPPEAVLRDGAEVSST